MSFYDRDPTVPYWRSNVDVDSLFAAHAHRPERAQAWLKFRDVSECSILEQAVMMRGHFELGLLPFVESAPRAYRLKASNAAPPISTFPGAIPRIGRAGREHVFTSFEISQCVVPLKDHFEKE